MQHKFGIFKHLSRTQKLLRVLSPGTPVDVSACRDLKIEMAFGNDPSAAVQADDIPNVVHRVHLRRVLVSDAQFVGEILGFRVPPWGSWREHFGTVFHVTQGW